MCILLSLHKLAIVSIKHFFCVSWTTRSTVEVGISSLSKHQLYFPFELILFSLLVFFLTDFTPKVNSLQIQSTRIDQIGK